jgi:hypothetical protein
MERDPRIEHPDIELPVLDEVDGDISAPTLPTEITLQRLLWSRKPAVLAATSEVEAGQSPI